MIKSMTGYGKANLEKEKRKYQIEIKSVNHRYSDISIKMPRQLAYLEEPIKRKVSEKVKRGKIDIFITFENEGIEGKEIKINTELASGYIKALKELAEKENREPRLYEVYPHKFRHTFVTKLNESNMSPFTVSKIVGHTSVNMTNYYTHLEQDYVADEFRKFAAKYDEGKGPAVPEKE